LFLVLQGVSLQVAGEADAIGNEGCGLAASTSLLTLVIGIKALYVIRGIPMVSGVSGALRRYCTKVLAKKVGASKGWGAKVLMVLVADTAALGGMGDAVSDAICKGWGLDAGASDLLFLFVCNTMLVRTCSAACLYCMARPAAYLLVSLGQRVDMMLDGNNCFLHGAFEMASCQCMPKRFGIMWIRGCACSFLIW
jgi:hypothetical protein